MKIIARLVFANGILAVALMTFSACASRHAATSTCCQMPPAAVESPTPAPAEPAKPSAAEAPKPVAAPVAEPAAKVTLSVVKVDSEETAGEDGKGANAVDGNPDTFWHTQWQDASPEPPHEIIIALSQAATIKGFTYLPRQDDSENGNIKDYEFYVSNDGQDFGQPVSKGTFENNKEKKTVTFEPVQCRFIKLRALSEVNSQAWTSAAEIGVLR